MKTRFLILTSTFLSCSGFSQDILWEKTFGGKEAEYLFDAQPTADYGFILAGSSNSGKTGNKTEDNRGDLDYWLWKMDEKGEMEWQKAIGGGGQDLLCTVKITNDGGFILGGTSNSDKSGDKKEDSRGGNDFWVVKLDAGGGEQWQKTFGGTDSDELTCIVQSKDGGYLLGGNSSSSPIDSKTGEPLGEKKEKTRGNKDYWIIKIDSEGNIEWQKTYGGSYAESLKSMAATKDGGYIIGGNSNSPASGDKQTAGFGANDMWILKLKDTGDVEWQQSFGGEQDDQLYEIIATNDGNFLAAGHSNSGATGNRRTSSRKGSDFWLVKLDQSGESLWQESYDIGQNDIVTSVVENKDGSLLIGGFAKTEKIDEKTSDKKEINDFIGLKVNQKGEELWRRTVGSGGEDVLRKLIETRDGAYLMAGTTKGGKSRDKNSSKGKYDFWVVKLKDKEKKVEARQNIEAIPNPAINYTNVVVGYEFRNGKATVFDLSGRQLQSFEITSRTVPVNLSGLPDGIYLVQIITDVSNDSVKVMKTK
jgi:hypothetical protein